MSLEAAAAPHVHSIGVEPIAERLATYRTTAIAWDALSGDPAKANKVFVDLHQMYKSLRDTEAGRMGIARLMDDSAVAVRLTAAAHSLFWSPERAERVLRAIQDDPNAGLHAVTAKYTLKEFHAGRLSHDW